MEGILEKVNPQALEKYKNLNAVYGETIEGLLPPISRKVIESANANSYYEALGRLAISTGDSEKVTGLLKSIDKGFAVLKKEGITPDDLVVGTAKEARELVRQGYLKSIFGDTKGSFDMNSFVKEAESLDIPANSSRVKAILGDAYPEYKQLTNAMREATIEPKGMFGGLVLRGKEAGSATATATNMAAGVLAAAGVGEAVGAGAGVVTASAVFLTPVLLAKIAGDKTAIRKLLLLNSQSKKLSGATLSAFVASNIGKVILELSNEDKKEVRTATRDQDEVLNAIGGQ